jgi:hypothetical protein
MENIIGGFVILITIVLVAALFRSLGMWGPHADDDDVYGGY